jgi:hypothetical protein
MRVVVKVSKFYDWKPVPPDVTVTEADIKSLKVKPAAGGGFVMRTVVQQPSETTVTFTEAAIIALIIHEAMPQQGSMQTSRKEAVGLLLARNVMPYHAHRSFMQGFQVDDDGPHEELFRAKLAPYLAAVHEASGEPLIAADELEGLVAKYMEKAAPEDHVDHLHTRFNVKKAPPAAPAKAVGP